jgi:hypothetical protein
MARVFAVDGARKAPTQASMRALQRPSGRRAVRTILQRRAVEEVAGLAPSTASEAPRPVGSLEPGSRDFAQPLFGRDFSRIMIYGDQPAAFGPPPVRSSGRHVAVQQQRVLSRPHDSFEREADDATQRVLGAGSECDVSRSDRSPQIAGPGGNCAAQRANATTDRTGAAVPARSLRRSVEPAVDPGPPVAGRDLSDADGAAALHDKFVVGPSDDPLEREAERMAAGFGAATATGIRRAAVGTVPVAAPPLVATALNTPGAPLDGSARTVMESYFGHDLTHVRVHVGSVAAQSADEIHAAAYTAGRDIVFGADRYQPATPEGRKLLAHELTHVLQEGRSSSARVSTVVIRRQSVPGPCADLEVPHRLVVRRSVHPAVREAQRKLNRHSDALAAAGEPRLPNTPLVPDCIFGPATEQAVLAFQIRVFPSRPEEHDGKIGDRTWAELDRAPASPKPAPGPPGTPGPAPAPPGTPGPAPAPPGTPGPAPAPSIRIVKLWLNAFIPRDVPGVTEPAPAAHTGTMVRGPTAISDCYLTDDRSFSSRLGASSRMHSEIELDVARAAEVFQRHVCDPTHEIDCEDGDPECTTSSDTSRMHYRNVRGTPGTSITVDVLAAANNPCQTGSPDIDYEGTFAVDVTARTVNFDGKIDSFPAFEAYAAADGASGVTLFNTMPLPGKTPGDLFGGATRVQTGRATI